MGWYKAGHKEKMPITDSREITEKGSALDARQANRDIEGTLAHDIYKEISETKKSASDGKTAVAAAITAMNQATASSAAYSTMAANIKKISSDATAGTGHILTGKTAYAGGKKITGTMPDQGAKTASLNCGGSYTIPAGYHNGSGRITAGSLASQTGATAQAQHILAGQTAWVNGSRVTGNAVCTSGVNLTELYSFSALADLYSNSKSVYNGGLTIGDLFNFHTNKSKSTRTINGISYSRGCVAFDIGIDRYKSVRNCAGLLLEGLQGTGEDFSTYIFIDKGLADIYRETTPVRLYYPWGTGILHNAMLCSDGTLRYSWYSSSDGDSWIEAKYRLFAVTL